WWAPWRSLRSAPITSCLPAGSAASTFGLLWPSSPATTSRSVHPRNNPVDMPAIISATPPKKQLKGPVIRLREQQQANDNGATRSDDTTTSLPRSAIVEVKPKPNAMLTHLFEDITDEERNRRADMAVEMFREIKRRVALPPREKE